MMAGRVSIARTLGARTAGEGRERCDALLERRRRGQVEVGTPALDSPGQLGPAAAAAAAAAAAVTSAPLGTITLQVCGGVRAFCYGQRGVALVGPEGWGAPDAVAHQGGGGAGREWVTPHSGLGVGAAVRVAFAGGIRAKAAVGPGQSGEGRYARARVRAG
jgi:hypothetical protein